MWRIRFTQEGLAAFLILLLLGLQACIIVVDADGDLVEETAIPLPGMPMIHDMSLTKNYAVIFDLPVTLSLLAAAAGAVDAGHSEADSPVLQLTSSTTGADQQQQRASTPPAVASGGGGAAESASAFAPACRCPSPPLRASRA